MKSKQSDHNYVKTSRHFMTKRQGILPKTVQSFFKCR